MGVWEEAVVGSENAQPLAEGENLRFQFQTTDLFDRAACIRFQQVINFLAGYGVIERHQSHISRVLVVNKQKECGVDQKTIRHIFKNSNFAGRTIPRCRYPNRWPRCGAGSC